MPRYATNQRIQSPHNNHGSSHKLRSTETNQNQTSKELLTQTKQIIGMLGPPKVFCHDKEKGLTGGEFKEHCEHMNIAQIKTKRMGE